MTLTDKLQWFRDKYSAIKERRRDSRDSSTMSSLAVASPASTGTSNITFLIFLILAFLAHYIADLPVILSRLTNAWILIDGVRILTHFVMVLLYAKLLQSDNWKSNFTWGFFGLLWPVAGMGLLSLVTNIPARLEWLGGITAFVSFLILPSWFFAAAL